MAQGDTFVSGDGGTVAANTTDYITVTTPSGVHAVVTAMSIGDAGFNTNGGARIYARDTGSNKSWTANPDEGASRYESWVHSSGFSGDTYTGRVHIDDTVGLRAVLENAAGSSRDYSYAIHGQEVK